MVLIPEALSPFFCLANSLNLEASSSAILTSKLNPPVLLSHDFPTTSNWPIVLFLPYQSVQSPINMRPENMTGITLTSFFCYK
jgi:hypothetical protein